MWVVPRPLPSERRSNEFCGDDWHMIEFRKFHYGFGVITSNAGCRNAINSECITKTMLSSICQFLRLLKMMVALLKKYSENSIGSVGSADKNMHFLLLIISSFGRVPDSYTRMSPGARCYVLEEGTSISLLSIASALENVPT